MLEGTPISFTNRPPMWAYPLSNDHFTLRSGWSFNLGASSWSEASITEQGVGGRVTYSKFVRMCVYVSILDKMDRRGRAPLMIRDQPIRWIQPFRFRCVMHLNSVWSRHMTYWMMNTIGALPYYTLPLMDASDGQHGSGEKFPEERSITIRRHDVWQRYQRRPLTCGNASIATHYIAAVVWECAYRNSLYRHCLK